MPDESPVPTSTRVVVAGGGAAGFFAAIACAEAGGGPVVLLEKSPTLLAKVRISGGGRCNVTQACFDPAVLVTRFPRGGRELRGPLHRFQPRDTMAWFESRGVTLKTEFDGRVFPVTDRSETIIDCLTGAAAAANVQVIRHAGVENSTRIIERFLVRITGGRSLECDKLIVATGGTRGTQGGPAIAASFGHTPDSLPILPARSAALPAATNGYRERSNPPPPLHEGAAGQANGGGGKDWPRSERLRESRGIC